MAEVGTAFVTIVPSARGFGSALNAQTGPASSAAGVAGGKRFGGTFLGGAKSALKGFAGIFAVGLVVKGLKDVVAEAREAQKVGALTAQVIKSTGGAANVTASQVEKLATALSNKTAVDDEVIQHGANLLLTFKNVRNEAGKGADIFNQATAAAIDLSAAGFGSIDSASKMLGKALNDPIKGMTALGRAGVTFTASQQKTIKALVQSGDLLGAQKIILGEVKSQVGGAGAASATAGEKMRVAWNNAKESLGTALLPALDSLQIAITTKIIPAIVAFIGFLQRNPTIVKVFAVAVLAIAAAFVVAFVAANALVIGIGILVGVLVVAVGAIAKNWDKLWSKTKAIFSAGVNFIKAHWRAFLVALLTIVAGPIGLLVGLFATNLGKIVGFFKKLPGQIKSALGNLGHLLLNAGKSIVQGLIDGIQSKFAAVKAKLRSLTSLLPSWKGPASTDRRLLTDNGQLIIDSLIRGFELKKPDVRRSLQSMTGTISTASLPTSGLASPRLSAVGPLPASSSVGSVGRLTITNWKDGTGHFEVIADSRIDRNDHAGAMRARWA